MRFSSDLPEGKQSTLPKTEDLPIHYGVLMPL